MTTSVQASKTEADVRYFFGYFRKQIEAIDFLVVEPVYLPSRHVLAGAALDALANHWAALKPLTKERAADRMQRFLEATGDPNVFTRVSQPDLMKRASAKKGGLSPAQCEVLQKAAPDLPEGRVRRSEEDPRLDQLVKRVAGSGIQESWLECSSYGRLIYKLHRCGWVHEFGAVRALGFEPSVTSPDFIGYENYNGGARLVIPIKFMRDTIATTVDRFEEYCLRNGHVPARAVDDDDDSGS